MSHIASISNIPKVLVQEILLFAGHESMPSCSLVCKKWNQLIQEEYFLKRLNRDYINFSQNIKKILDNEGASLLEMTDSKMLKGACLNTFPFSEEKVLEKVDQFFSQLFLKENTTAGERKYWCFFRKPDILFCISEQMKNIQKNCIFTIIPKEDLIGDKQVMGVIRQSMITSPSHNIKLCLIDYGYFKANVKANFEAISNGSINILLKHIEIIESRWCGADPSKIAIYNVTVHHETASEGSIYIAGTGARVWHNTATYGYTNLDWKHGVILTSTKGHNWTCKLQRSSEESVQFKFLFIKGVLKNSLAWEIIDNDPLKNRVINMGDSKEIYIDNLTFQK